MFPVFLLVLIPAADPFSGRDLYRQLLRSVAWNWTRLKRTDLYDAVANSRRRRRIVRRRRNWDGGEGTSVSMMHQPPSEKCPLCHWSFRH
jgi:hypothetical protein